MTELTVVMIQYHDGRLKAVKEAWMEVDPDFGFDINSETRVL